MTELPKTIEPYINEDDAYRILKRERINFFIGNLSFGTKLRFRN